MLIPIWNGKERKYYLKPWVKAYKSASIIGINAAITNVSKNFYSMGITLSLLKREISMSVMYVSLKHPEMENTNETISRPTEEDSKRRQS